MECLDMGEIHWYKFCGVQSGGRVRRLGRPICQWRLQIWTVICCKSYIFCANTSSVGSKLEIEGATVVREIVIGKSPEATGVKSVA